MVKRILALTLIGLMTIVLVPVCANAQVQPENLTVVPDDPYDLTPTLEWTCVSGPTIFKVSVNDVEESTSVDAGTLTDGKWDREGIEVVPDVDETYKYSYDLTLEAAGTYTWQVVAEREDAKTTKTDGYVADAVAGDAITVLGDITLSLVADKTEAEIDDAVTVTVSMDNSTNGDVPVNTLTFSIGYNADVVEAPNDATPLGNASAITPTVQASGSGATAKATVTLTGNIIAGTGDILSLEFTVTGAGENTFALNAADIAITSASVAPPTGEASNPAVVGGDSQVLTVAEPVTQGDLNGDDAVTLADAVIALKVLAGMTITADVSAHVAEYGKIDAGLVVYILKTILAG
jgi:hypothetical protein